MLPISLHFAHFLLFVLFLSVLPLFQRDIAVLFARAEIEFWYQYNWITQLPLDFPVSSRLASIVDILMQLSAPKQVKFGSFQKLLRILCFVCKFVGCAFFFCLRISLFVFPRLYSWHVANDYANAQTESLIRAVSAKLMFYSFSTNCAHPWNENKVEYAIKALWSLQLLIHKIGCN